MKFKKGDKVKVIKNSYSGYSKGTICIFKEYLNNKTIVIEKYYNSICSSMLHHKNDVVLAMPQLPLFREE